ncbi:MAG: Crp/Fnr family transcriptional regulator [Limnobacter sp.]|nr:Crp/Fnr family transcriptional regulator [Limnobacter sp.]
MLKEQILPILMRGKWFSALPDQLQQFLVDQGTLKTLSAGQRLFSRGDAADGIFGVINGTIQIAGASKAGSEDKQAILTLIDPPDWFGEICLFDNAPRTHVALDDSQASVLHVRQAAFDQYLLENPHHWKDIGLLLTQKIRLMFFAMEDIALLPTPMRLVRRLVQMAEGYGIRSRNSGMVCMRTLHVSQEKLSAILAISRQTTNQILKQLEGEGLLQLHRGTIEIVDYEGLKKRAIIDSGA